MHEVVVKDSVARSRHVRILRVSYTEYHHLRAFFDAPSLKILHLEPTRVPGTLPLGGEI
jgi:hypothetical protein